VKERQDMTSSLISNNKEVINITDQSPIQFDYIPEKKPNENRQTFHDFKAHQKQGLTVSQFNPQSRPSRKISAANQA
jgi:hypothetical protein